MNKQDFLQRLESGLAGVAPDERVAAVQYYTEYFDDAGQDREADVLAELGNPDKLAADIKAVSGLIEDLPVEEAAAPVVLEAEEVTIVQDPFDMAEVPKAPDIPAAPEIPGAPVAEELPVNEAGTVDGIPPQYRFPGGYVPPRYGAGANGQPYYEGTTYAPGAPYGGQVPPAQPGYAGTVPPAYSQRPVSNGGSTAVKVILAIVLLMFSPALFGFAVAGLVMLCIPLIIGAAFVFSGVLMFLFSLMVLGGSVGSGLLILGLALLFLAGGLLVFWAGIKLIAKGIPAVARGIASLFRSIFGS